MSAANRWASAYSGADANLAYAETQKFTQYVEQIQRDGRPLNFVPDMLVWNYARLGFLAEHLGKKEESTRYFATATRYAKKAHPTEPDGKTSEAALRAALEEMDSPATHLWRGN